MKWRKARKKPIIVEFREVESKILLRRKRDITGLKEEIFGELVDTGHEGSIVYAYPDVDFIIRDKEGEYPIKKELFYETYEVLENE